MSQRPHLAYGTPRRLPKASSLHGRVVVLDIAFAAETSGASFKKITKKLIDGLGDRLAMWIDHHDHALHAAYRADPRFILATKAQHGACPEMVTPERVERAGPIDTICCHVDFDGLCSAAKWIRGGMEPYPGADEDARAIDTRLGTPSSLGSMLDRALRVRPKDDSLKTRVVHFLASGADDATAHQELAAIAAGYDALQDQAGQLAEKYRIFGGVAVVDVRGHSRPFDKTELLLLGQEHARVAVVHDARTVTIAARFDSGIDLLSLFQLEGGMPTRISLPAGRLRDVLDRLSNLDF